MTGSNPDEKVTVSHPDHKVSKGGFFARRKHSPNDEKQDEKNVEVSTDVSSRENLAQPVSFFQLFR